MIMKKLIITAAISAMIAVPVSCTTITFGQEGINYSLSGGDVTLVPADGVSTLEVTANQSSYNGKVTISELVDKIIFRGSGTLFRDVIPANYNVVIELAPAPEGEEYVNAFYGPVLYCSKLVIGAKNKFHFAGINQTMIEETITKGTLVMGAPRN
jgi:hypothetical protein